MSSPLVAGFPRCFQCHRRSRWVVENVTGTKRYDACPKHVHAALEAHGGPHRVVAGSQRVASEHEYDPMPPQEQGEHPPCRVCGRPFSEHAKASEQGESRG